MVIMLKHNQHHQVIFSLSSSGSYNAVTTAEQNLK